MVVREVATSSLVSDRGGSLLPPQASLCSQPHTAPLLQGPGFLPLCNKLRNLQRLLDPRTRGSQVCDITSLVRTTALRQVTKLDPGLS